MEKTQRNKKMEIVTAFFLFFFMVRFASCSNQSSMLKKVPYERRHDKWEVQAIEDENTEQSGSSEEDLIVNGLPGQPFTTDFQQYAGYITVDTRKGRRLFYYFAEAAKEPTTAPLILWLNGGPGCSSFGIGAMVEHGPFGVNPDGKTLYLRKHSWNQVANMLYLESPAGVGFSYSNTTSDYNTTGDARTARDSYVFLTNWFRRFPQFINVDFCIAGESYGGIYVPELAEVILHNMPTLQLKGVIVGNGVINKLIDERGRYDYLFYHALISRKTLDGLIENCIMHDTVGCVDFQNDMTFEMGNVFLDCLYSEPCLAPYSTNMTKREDSVDPCEEEYVVTYLNNIEVQRALHVNKEKLPYAWTICRLFPWRDGTNTSQIYKKLAAAGIRVLLYSGDLDGIIPFTSTQYSIEDMNLQIKKPWRAWLDMTKKVGGYKVDYNGLTFMTVRGAGHEVPRYKPDLALSMLMLFLEDEA